MRTYASVFVLGVLAMSAANASPITFDFGTLAPVGHSAPSGTVYYPTNTSLVFSNGGMAIGASATNMPARDWKLTQRDNGGGAAEAGLGVDSSADITSTPREIGPDEFLTLDYSGVIAAGGSIQSITLGSVQSHSSTCEGFEIFASNTMPTTYSGAMGGTFVAQSGSPGSCGGDLQTINLGPFSTYSYLSITALQDNNPYGLAVSSPANDVTVGTTVVNMPDKQHNVPEPATWTILAMSLASLGFLRRRTLRQKR